MTISDRLAKVPAWTLFVFFGVGVIFIGLSTAPIAHKIEPRLENKSAAPQSGGQPPPPQTPKESSANVAAFLEQELSDSKERVEAAQETLRQAKARRDSKAIQEAQETYDAAKRNYSDLLARKQNLQMASSLETEAPKEPQIASSISSSSANSESSFAIAEEYVTLGMKVLLTLAMVGASLFIVLSKRYTPQAKHWGYGMLGTILGWWLKI